MRTFLRGRRAWYAGAAILVAAVIGAMAMMYAARDREPRAREYLDVTACLLTDERGIAGTEAAPVWAGMQQASLATRARVRYLAVAGDQTVENAATFLASLAHGNCARIYAAGDLPRKTVDATAAQFPDVRFVVVGRAQTAPNVSSIDDSEVSTNLTDAIT
jgi:basic membrane lipoprotein Med (substrate-binding protein (PBP1-ABC) superfamily)